MKRIDRKKVEKEWKARGFSCGLWCDPPGKTWEDFYHEEDELFMGIDGDIELEIDGHPFHPDHGQEVFIPAKIFHSVRNIGQKDARYLFGYKEALTVK